MTRRCARLAGGCALAAFVAVLSTASAHGDACANAQFRTGPSEGLPDCRAYEQVSPVEKGGLDAVTLQPLLPAQSSACADGEVCTIAYMNVGAAFAGALGNDFPDAYLASRSDGGWQTTSLSPPTPSAPGGNLAQVSYAFSADLSSAVVRVPLQPLTANAPAGVYNLFVRQPGGGYTLVTAASPAEAPQPGCGACFEAEDKPVFAGASRDFTHVIFEANDSLEGAPGGEIEGRRPENLYEASGERVRPVGVLPDGVLAPQGSTPGGGLTVTEEHTGELAHAISQDGSHVLFAAAADGGEPDPAQKGDTELYDRIGEASTLEVSAPAAGAQPAGCETKAGVCNPEGAQFGAASADGSLVYFTSSAALTKQSFTGPESASEPGGNPGADLYRYDVATRTLTDITVDASNPEDPDGAKVLGVVGASEDGSYVYFVAEGKLASGTHSERPNLYVWHEAEGAGTVSFIATLARPDHFEEFLIANARALSEDLLGLGCGGLDHERRHVQMRGGSRSLKEGLLGRADADLQAFFLGR